jgi:hypothetical protein
VLGCKTSVDMHDDDDDARGIPVISHPWIRWRRVKVTPVLRIIPTRADEGTAFMVNRERDKQ